MRLDLGRKLGKLGAHSGTGRVNMGMHGNRGNRMEGYRMTMQNGYVPFEEYRS